MSPPEQQPKFFVDRSLGRVAVPGLLRAAGWDLITLAEHYGVPEDEKVEDTRWIEDSAKLGWAVLMKDKRIRYRQAEIEAVIEHQARCFVVPRRPHFRRLRRTICDQPESDLRCHRHRGPLHLRRSRRSARTPISPTRPDASCLEVIIEHGP
ncbi:hypothetical protein [Acrocarpospora macrocephala]|uniref:PIN-like domain-containing protein n=1 Tax=Acrocarpospora macrocephala TaxID=150177 RepID=UPI0014792553